MNQTWICSKNCSKNPKHFKKIRSEAVQILNADRHHEDESIFATVQGMSLKWVGGGGAETTTVYSMVS